MVTASTDLGPIFDRLGLGRYLERFLDEGFETWETVVDITESDLCVHSGNSSALPAYHLCKRRIRRQARPSTGTCSLKPGPKPWQCLATNGQQRLQREIANARGVDLDIITTATSSSKPHHAIQLDADDDLDLPPAGGPGRAKRKYRRHPKASFIANVLLYEKADTYAPDRPQSAYVVFSNSTFTLPPSGKRGVLIDHEEVREDLRSENLSFTEMAKRVGEMWQALASEEREPFEAQAGSAKEEYLAEMAQYRLSSNYKVYAEYLADFKAKHPSSADSKKPRLESHASTASSGSIETPSDSVELPHHEAPPRIDIPTRGYLFFARLAITFGCLCNIVCHFDRPFSESDSPTALVCNEPSDARFGHMHEPTPSNRFSRAPGLILDQQRPVVVRQSDRFFFGDRYKPALKLPEILSSTALFCAHQSEIVIFNIKVATVIGSVRDDCHIKNAPG
ncbi:MAG: hypothetical protein Q9210_002387 [Variospora velana]